MAYAGKSLSYTVQIPKDHPPGCVLGTDDNAPHGESYRRARTYSRRDVTEGIESLIFRRRRLAGASPGCCVGVPLKRPSVYRLKQRVNSVRTFVAESKRRGRDHDGKRVRTAQIEIAPGERQFWAFRERFRGSLRGPAA